MANSKPHRVTSPRNMNVKLQILSIKNAPSKALLPKDWPFKYLETEKISHIYQKKDSLLNS